MLPVHAESRPLSQCGPQAPRTVLPDPLVSSLPQHFSTDPVAASIMKIHTFNKDRDRVKLGVDTIAKWVGSPLPPGTNSC